MISFTKIYLIITGIPSKKLENKYKLFMENRSMNLQDAELVIKSINVGKTVPMLNNCSNFIINDE